MAADYLVRSPLPGTIVRVQPCTESGAIKTRLLVLRDRRLDQCARLIAAFRASVADLFPVTTEELYTWIRAV